MAEPRDGANSQQPQQSTALPASALRDAARETAEQELSAAREALRVSEQRLSAVFNQAAVGIAVSDLHGRFEQANQRLLDILGYTFEELQRLTYFDITHPEDLPQTQEHTRRLLARDVTEFIYEKRFVRKDGSSVWTLTTVTGLKDASGVPWRFIGVIEDITKRKMAEAALQARERELSLIYSNVSDVIFHIAVEAGGQYRFRSVNPAFLTTTGLAIEQVEGKLVQEVIPEPSCSVALEHYATAVRERQTVRWEETTDYPSGRKVGLVSVTPIFDSTGACINLIGTVHDITQRKQEEEVRARLAAVVESSDDAIISKSLTGVIMTWNAGAERIFGYRAEEVIGKSVTILIPPDRIEEETDILARLRQGGAH